MDFTIDSMTADDLPEVMEIERIAFPVQPWTNGLFLHELKIPFSRVHVLRAGNGSRKIAGYVCWWVVGEEAQILNLAVHPDYRRHGVGRTLVGVVVADAALRAATTVTLEVRSENAAARALYASLGFLEVGCRRNYYGLGEDALIMTCRLASPLPEPA